MSIIAPKCTYFEVLKKFEQIERELKLDQSLIQNVPWWEVVRYTLFLEILNKLGLRNDNSLDKNFFFKIIPLLIGIIKSVCNAIFSKSPLWIKKKNFIIYGHPRRKLEKDIYVDIYTDPFIDLFPSNTNFTVIEKGLNSNHLTPAKTENIFYSDFFELIASLVSRLKKVNVKSNEFLIVSELEKLIEKNFFCKIDIKKIVKNKIKRWLGIFPIFKFFFKIKKPKLFFIVSSNYNEPIVAAAKSLGIITIELQHGSPARGKLNYDYSSSIKKNSFPDFFLSFGKFWTSDILMPIENKNIISFGFPYLQNKISLYKNINKEDRLVVISQMYNSKELADFAIKINNRFNKKITVEFKPHPLEYLNEPYHFNILKKNGIIISGQNRDIYEIFAQSKWQVGVCSTALYEGLCFETACFILKLPGFELMQKLTNLNFAKLIETVEDIDLDYKINKNKYSKIFDTPNINKLTFI